MMKFINVILYGKKLYFPKLSVIILLLFVLLFSWVYNFPDTLTIRPQGPHQWRQTDCLSITGRYYYKEADFFHPKIYNLLDDNEGKTVSEFPILYYVVALLWRVFGKHEWIYRLLNYIFSLIGMIALMKGIESRIRDSFWSIWIVLLLFSSGIYAYYTLNFLPNITAFNFVLIGWYFFFRFESRKKHYLLFICFFFFLAGGLLKISSTMSLIAIMIIFLLEWTGLISFKDDGKIFPQPAKVIIPVLLVIALLISWYVYAVYYNRTGNSGVFLVGIWPIWVLNMKEIKDIIEQVWEIGIQDYYYPATQLLLIILFISMFILIKKTDKLLTVITLLLGLAFLSFLVLFFYALGYNNYYLIDLLIFSVFILFTFFEAICKTKGGSVAVNTWMIRILMVVFLLLNVIHTKNRLEDFYTGWWNNRHLKELYGFEDIEPYLDSLGITRDQKVISPDETTNNSSLYLMNRKGWSGYGTNMKDSLKIVRRIQQGAGWLTLTHDFEGPGYSHWKYFIKEQVGQHKNIRIYRIGMPGEK